MTNNVFMININYQSYGSAGLLLRLRLYKEGETRYVNVTKLLKGNPASPSNCHTTTSCAPTSPSRSSTTSSTG